jgi:hypothetical protein
VDLGGHRRRDELVPCFTIGPRDSTSDGHKPYLEAVEDAFGADIDYAMLVKTSGADPKPSEARFSEGLHRHSEDRGRREPGHKHVSTGYLEGQNLTMRMTVRRFTRLTNPCSKKLDNHWMAVVLHAAYNLCRVHQTLRVTRAMAAGVADHVWEIEEIVGLLDRKAENQVA